jgi:hypothetical protein
VLIEVFTILRLSEEDDSLIYLDDNSTVDESKVILTRDECSMIKDKFYKETESTYLQALRDQVTGKFLKIF